MTTRLELRTSLRRRMEDTGGTPLWDDATLNELLSAAIRRYGARFLVERSVTVTAAAGVMAIAVVPALQGAQIARVLDPVGEVIPRQRRIAPDERVAIGQAWRWWAGSIRLAVPAAAGIWTVEYLGARAAPVDDVSAVEVIDGDEEIVVLLAASAAAHRRSIEDAKRGLGRGADGMDRLATQLQASAERLIAARRRQATGSVLEMG